MNQTEEQKSAEVKAELQRLVSEREKYRIQATRRYYQEELMPAKENGKKVVYTPGIGFGEIVHAFEGVVLAVPSDSYCVMTAAKRKHRKYLEISEAAGFNSDLCSYDRLSTGLMLAGEGEFGPVPAPDVIISSSNMCDTHARLWDIWSDHYNGVPFYPFYYPIPETEERMSDSVIEFGSNQVRRALNFIAEHTGKKVDWDRFKEVTKLAIETITFYMENVTLPRVASPSPWSLSYAMSDAFFLAVYLGRPEALEYFKLCAKEIQFRIKHKIGVNPKEKYRVLYTEIPPWFWLEMIRILQDKGATVAFESYPSTFWLSILYDKYFNIEPVYDLDPEKPDEAVFLRLANMSMGRSQKHMLDQYVLATEKFNLDGAIFFTNRTCQICTRSMPLRESLYRERTGKPTMSFAGEHCDDRTFSQSQTMAKIDAFVNAMEKQKLQRGAA